jgi:hypothetical protein
MMTVETNAHLLQQSMSDPPAVHGMLLVGANHIFLSHLPMFHSPHDYQVLLTATFKAEGVDPAAAYIQDRRKTGGKLYTWAPEPFTLPSLMREPASPMFGTIFRGHFERGGTALMSDRVRADVTSVFHFRRFIPSTNPAEHSKYILFGELGDRYLAHWITRPPDFDQVVSVVLRNESHFEIPESNSILVSDRKNSVDCRLVAGEKISGTALPNERLVDFEVGAEIYVETDDLAK